jgi:preprotein translocase subunit SecD
MGLRLPKNTFGPNFRRKRSKRSMRAGDFGIILFEVVRIYYYRFMGHLIASFGVRMGVLK